MCSLLFLCALGHSVLGVLLYRVLGSIAPAVFTSGFLIFLVSELVPHIVCSGYGFQLAPGFTWLAQVCMEPNRRKGSCSLGTNRKITDSNREGIPGPVAPSNLIYIFFLTRR